MQRILNIFQKLPLTCFLLLLYQKFKLKVVISTYCLRKNCNIYDLIQKGKHTLLLGFANQINSNFAWFCHCFDYCFFNEWLPPFIFLKPSKSLTTTLLRVSPKGSSDVLIHIKVYRLVLWVQIVGNKRTKL